MDLDRTIYIGRDDSIPEVLRELLDLADSPAEVVMQVGTREVQVSQAVAERFEGAHAGPDLDDVQEPAEEPELTEGTAETPAPRKRAPRKAATPAAEETA